jgi:hypothetical protein
MVKTQAMEFPVHPHSIKATTPPALHQLQHQVTACRTEAAETGAQMIPHLTAKNTRKLYAYMAKLRRGA